MLASVIVPTYNRADFLARCLRSLVSTRAEGIEVIVVDDGGTDNSSEVVAQFASARYLRQANAGPAAARNLGFAASRGRYVAFIDSDDEWIDSRIIRLVAQLEANPDVSVMFADAAVGSAERGYVSFVDTYGGDAFFAVAHESRDGVRVLDRHPFFIRLSTRNVMFLGSAVFRREAFEALGGFDPALRGAADWNLFMRAAARGGIAFSEGPAVTRYQVHPAAMSHDSDHMQEDSIKALESVCLDPALSPEERTHIERRLKELMFGWAYSAYDRGDMRLARQRLRRGSRSMRTLGVREMAYLMATYLGPDVIGTLRRARRSLGL